MSYHVFIPARYASTRFPGKPLIDIAGKSMIQRVYERASRSAAAAVHVATDDNRIADAVVEFGGNVIMTRDDHESGTDRIHEAAEAAGLANDDVVVNVQGDEPLVPPEVIDQVAGLIDTEAEMATLMGPMSRIEDIHDPNIVKVVTDDNRRALYFSRSPVPFARQGFEANTPGQWFRHIGIYSFRKSFLNRFVRWPAHTLEMTESLEQLRALGNGAAIRCEPAIAEMPPGIDVPGDVERTLAAINE